MKDLDAAELSRLQKAVETVKVEGDLRKEISQKYFSAERDRNLPGSAPRERVYRSGSADADQCPDQAGPESNYWSFEERDIGRKRSGS